MNKDYDLADLNLIAKQVVSNVYNKTLLFYGSMGVGKTTLIKEICKELDTEDITSSPTFSLVNEYRTNKGEIIYHFDFYRIEDEKEAFDIGVEDYFDTDAWCLIEWPENIQNLLPLKSTMVHLTQLKNGCRNIQLKPFL
tara:strand:- start:43 stop:459 length:417 start_codon:yes stop_codon:yes gene_type:complete